MTNMSIKVSFTPSGPSSVSLMVSDGVNRDFATREKAKNRSTVARCMENYGK
jgi:hypothetical protein